MATVLTQKVSWRFGCQSSKSPPSVLIMDSGVIDFVPSTFILYDTFSFRSLIGLKKAQPDHLIILQHPWTIDRAFAPYFVEPYGTEKS